MFKPIYGVASAHMKDQSRRIKRTSINKCDRMEDELGTKLHITHYIPSSLTILNLYTNILAPKRPYLR